MLCSLPRALPCFLSAQTSTLTVITFIHTERFSQAITIPYFSTSPPIPAQYFSSTHPIVPILCLILPFWYTISSWYHQGFFVDFATTVLFLYSSLGSGASFLKYASSLPPIQWFPLLLSITRRELALQACWYRLSYCLLGFLRFQWAS